MKIVGAGCRSAPQGVINNKLRPDFHRNISFENRSAFVIFRAFCAEAQNALVLSVILFFNQGVDKKSAQKPYKPVFNIKLLQQLRAFA